MGIFIQKFGNILNYLNILLIGLALTRAHNQALESISRLLSRTKRLAKIYSYPNYSYYIVSRKLFADIFEIFLNISGLFFIPLLLKIISLKVFFYSLLISLIIMLSSYALSLMLSPLFIYMRGETSSVMQIIRGILRILIPTYYLLSGFWFYNFTVLIPPTVLVEEFRRLLLFGKINLFMVILSLVVTLSYLVIGFILLRLFLDRARKKGVIKLI